VVRKSEYTVQQTREAAGEAAMRGAATQEREQRMARMRGREKMRARVTVKRQSAALPTQRHAKEVPAR